jgi:hypothetical protein
MEHGMDRSTVKVVCADESMIIVIGLCKCGNVDGCERTYNAWITNVWVTGEEVRKDIKDV